MRGFHPRLVALAARRTLPPWLLGLLLVLVLLAARGADGVPAASTDGPAAAAARALARQDAWSILFLAAPLLFFLAARIGTSAASEWLLAAPVPRLSLTLSLGAGCALACAGATAVTALASECMLPAGGPAWRPGPASPAPAALLPDGAAPVEWAVPAPPPGARLRLWTTVAPGSGPAVTARLAIRAGAGRTELVARVSGRTALELAPPREAEGMLALELAREGPGAVLVLPPGALQVLVPASSERAATLELALRALSLLVAGCGLALGLAGSLRPALVALLVLSLAVLAATRPCCERVVPGGDLARAWGEVSTGLVPGPAGAWPLAATAGLTALGLLLHARSLGRARRPS